MDPTEEKGAPHPFLPSRGDLCLLFSTQAPKLLGCCCLNAHPSPSFVPLRDGRWGEQKLRWGSVCLVGEGRRPGKVHLAVCLVYILELLLASAASCRGWLLGSISFCCKEAEMNCTLAGSPTESDVHRLFAMGCSC